jgi:large subunit ribosomal protein L6
MSSISLLPQKYNINIPENASIIYSEDKKIIIILGLFGKKIIKLRTKISLNVSSGKIYVSRIPFAKMSVNETKKLKVFQCSVVSLIKRTMLETNMVLYRKMRLTGIGFKGSLINTSFARLLYLKLGYSHPIYLKLGKKVNFSSLKTTTFFVFGHLYYEITETCRKIRSCKVPEVYKGKGVLYHNEVIALKKGKKT